MRISQGDLEWYRSSLIDLGQQAADAVRDALSRADGGVTARREAAIAAITETIGVHGDMAQALAGQLYDEVCAAEGIETDAFELFGDIIDEDMLSSKVRYFARALVEGDGGRFLDDCSALADFYVRRCNYESMIRNCYRNNVRYARVPTGPSTCDFCLMLASRGFVYYSEQSAREGSHRSCDCVVVPGGQSTSIEGYDPDMLYDLWQERVSDTASRRAERNGTSYQVERMRIMDTYRRSSRSARMRGRLR